MTINKTNNKKNMNILLIPVVAIGRFFSNLKKKIRMSISFKISVTYMALYLLAITIAILGTIIGYMSYKAMELERIGDIYSKLIISKTIDKQETLEDYLIDERLSGVLIYDSDFNQILNTKNYEDVYINNTFFKLETMLREEIYVFSASLYEQEQIYYINIYFNAGKIINEAMVIGVLVSLAGLLGFIIIAIVGPGVSKKLVKPIGDMTEVARTISVNNINTRLNVKASQHELRELAETFNNMMDRIEEDYLRQQQFVSDASHELRTPIAVLKGYTDMLDRWGKNDKAILDESIIAIKNEANNMQDLVEKLLFIARNDKKSLKLSKEEFNVNEIIEEVYKETTIIDEKHDISSPPCQGALIFADKNRIKQAVRIFVENARKFTPDGGKIEIYCSLDGEFIAINVRDSGVGIKKKQLKKIFDRFYRAEESREKETGGHGLGLAIAKIIVLGHRGKIKVKSVYGEGSVFTILLPYIKLLDDSMNQTIKTAQGGTE
ncbi:MAG: ATP-binding protein [Eubacteriales bacterium]|nr:ATP-binding protein [Eubacteriales bacterium]